MRSSTVISLAVTATVQIALLTLLSLVPLEQAGFAGTVTDVATVLVSASLGSMLLNRYYLKPREAVAPFFVLAAVVAATITIVFVSLTTGRYDVP